MSLSSGSELAFVLDTLNQPFDMLANLCTAHKPLEQVLPHGSSQLHSLMAATTDERVSLDV